MYNLKNDDKYFGNSGKFNTYIPETKYFSSYNLVAPQAYKEQDFPTFNVYEFNNSQVNKVPVNLF